MIVEKGIEMRGVCAELHGALKIIHLVFYEKGEHLIIVATKWGKDALRESHEAGHAIDVKKPLKNFHDVFWGLKKALGSNYVLRSIGDHIHIEYSPHGT